MVRKKSWITTVAVIAAGGSLLMAAGVLAQASNGCYVKIFDDENFKGRTATLRGPSRDDTLKDNKWSGTNKFIGDDTDSLITGPNSYFEGFEDKNFKGTVIKVGPNKRIADIEANGGDEIESYKLYDKKPAHWK